MSKQSLPLRGTAGESGKHLFLLVAAFITLIPIFWMLATSVKTPSDVFSGNLFIPSTFSLDGYRQVFQEIPFLRWFLNSSIITVIQTGGQLLVAICAAYAFSHFRFRGRELLFFFVLMTMMIPPQVGMVPTYMIINQMGLVNSFAGVILPQLASGYAIFLLRQTFLTIPKDLGEAAKIDGCNPLQIMWHVYVRLSFTVLVALGLILFVNNWNDYHWPLLVLSDKELQTLPVAFVQFREEHNLDWVPTMAVATLAILPILLLYLIAQKKFVEGMTHTGLKG
ncbi:carbohydrate ABC transporter permease [Evansella cellulosilytica]|uniref:Binding-protein-dependent transport systems inner membrane component n=1 Tax=Evansella cellulosilytica (strain ATCC 21833 / DSM 2522 / FERM P-1141 / JCM 9156 / N-4) TaxID=649639 RepID=E6TU05_EVAC2|nr:carbohydrate ABC transporter permease [Evansella cellulosilytica]ADU32036.1 binding-protein-dependent transport systems inner membrane component [Evansella cellulosilytica DSM 2522]